MWTTRARILVAPLIISAISAASLASASTRNQTAPTHPTAVATARGMKSAVCVVCSRDGKVGSYGSGVVVWAIGDSLFIVTNAHVVNGFDKVQVYTTSEHAAWPARVVGIDPDSTYWADRTPGVSPNDLLDVAGSDLALLAIRAVNELEPAAIAPPETLHDGDPVIAVGNPSGYGRSVSDGVVSALHRLMSGIWIQTSAPLCPGNSGGGIFNLDGELLGINTMKGTGANIEAIGFAIDVQTAMANADALRRYGKVSRAYFGIHFAPGTTTVDFIWPGTPAANGEVRAGDVLVGLNKVQVFTQKDLVGIVKRLVAGQSAEFTFSRDGVPRSVSLRGSERPPHGARSGQIGG